MKRRIGAVAVAAVLGTALAGCSMPEVQIKESPGVSLTADKAPAQLVGQVLSKGPNSEESAPASATALTWHPGGYPGNLAYSPELWEWMFSLACT
jgi:hypothetical protein